MKEALQPQRVPQPVNTVVAVPTLTPEFTLYNTITGETKRVYGGNPCENSVYVDGIMPKIFRMAAEEGNYEHEQITHPLPATIEEIVLHESPEYKLLIADYTMVELPEPKEKPGCVIIETPYAKADRERKEAEAYLKKAAKDRKKGCIPLQLQFDYQSSNRQSA